MQSIRSREEPQVHAMSVEASDMISVIRRADRVSEKQWKYLESEAFSIRYVLAAHFVSSCRSVVEIGGARTPIDRFLTGRHDRVIVLDPCIDESHTDNLNGRPCRVSHIRAHFQDVEWGIPAAADYALVMLGLQMYGMERLNYEMLYGLINRARVTVIEFPTSWSPSQAQFSLIRNHTRTKIRFHALLDLAGNDFGSMENSWTPRCEREIYVLEPLP
jgi:hypothetical protein